MLAGAAFAQERIILDSDSAVFNDDAAAMVMLLNRPDQVDLFAVTLVPGNMWPTAGADYMYRALDADKHSGIPMYVGARAPLVHNRADGAKGKRLGRRIPGRVRRRRAGQTQESRQAYLASQCHRYDD